MNCTNANSALVDGIYRTISILCGSQGTSTKKDCCTRKNPSAAASLPLFHLHFIPLQFECFRDGNIATAQARNSENMSAQGFVPATRAGKNPFVRTGTGYSIFICSPDGDLSIPNSFLTTTNPVVKRCAKRNKLAERGSYQMKAGKAHGFNRGMIGRQLRFSWNKIRAEEAHCVSGGGVYAFFKRSDYVQSVNITLFGLFLHQKNVIMPV